MDIATNNFPFILDENSITYEVFFDDNDDTKISFLKSQKALNDKTADVKLSLCKSDFNTFYSYIVLDTDMTKKLFYAELNFNGKQDTYLLDIISNLTVDYKSNIFNVSFKVIVKS